MALLGLVLLTPVAALAHEVLVATYDVNLTHSGPGITLQHLTRTDDAQVEAEIAVLAHLNADILLLTNIDYDFNGEALAALQKRLRMVGVIYTDALALQPNTGIPTWLDLNHDGVLSGPRDAQAYGRFPGQSGMAILSRFPIDRGHIVNLTNLLWKDLPGANLPPDMTLPEQLLQRLSTAGHYVVPVVYDKGKSLNLMAWFATPPMFDGPEDRNGRRNADETALWLHLLAGDLPDGPSATYKPPAAPYVLIGEPNIDPDDGEGLRGPLQTLLASHYVQDPKPKGSSGRIDAGQTGDPALDTALVGKSATGLRLDMILPSPDIKVKEAGVMWPASDDPFAATLALASHHRPVWVKISLP